MTIATELRRAGPYAGNGVAIAFPFNFKVFATGDVLVVRTDDSGDTELELTTDYGVALSSSQDATPGGTVTLLAPLPTNAQLTILSRVAALQPTELTNQGGFYPQVITRALDRATILIQQLAERVSRSLVLSPTEGDVNLPAPTLRRGGKILGFNRDTGAFEVQSGDAFIGAPGAADNTYVSLSAFKASDPGRKKATLTLLGVLNGDLYWTPGDTTPEDGINYFTSTFPGAPAGRWVRQTASGISFRRVGAQALLDLQTKAALTVNIEDFGAYPNPLVDSTAAIERALDVLPNGTQINFQPGGKYVVRRTLLFKKAFVFNGGGREQCEIHFAADGDYLTAGVGGPKAAMIFLHPSVVGITGYDGQPAVTATSYAGRSVLRGMRFSGDPNMPVNTVGLFVAAPIYGYECEFINFTSDGVFICAGADRPTKGNANGTTFTNCNSLGNKASGWSLIGNDVNRCVLTGCNSAQNALHGYYEDVIIGNTYISCEADGNSGTGYVSVRATSRSVYLHDYSETFPHFQVGPRCLILNMQGNISPERSYGGGYFGVLPSRDMFAYTPIVVAETEVIANVMGGPTGPGKAIRIGPDGLDWRMMPGQGITGFSGSANYAQWNVNGLQSTLWCAVDVVGNLKKGVQWAIGGLAFGVKSAILGSGSAPPTTGSYEQGAIFFNDSPTAGGKIGWVCVAAGSPGTWKAFGAIDA